MITRSIVVVLLQGVVNVEAQQAPVVKIGREVIYQCAFGEDPKNQCKGTVVNHDQDKKGTLYWVKFKDGVTKLVWPGELTLVPEIEIPA